MQSKGITTGVIIIDEAYGLVEAHPASPAGTTQLEALTPKGYDSPALRAQIADGAVGRVRGDNAATPRSNHDSSAASTLFSPMGVIVIDEAHSLAEAGRTSTGGEAQLEPLSPRISGSPDVGVDGIDRRFPAHRLLLTELTRADFSFDEGIARRFPAQPIVFEPLARADIEEIFDAVARRQRLEVTPEARTAAIDALDVAKHQPKFNNVRAIKDALAAALASAQAKRTG